MKKLLWLLMAALMLVSIFTIPSTASAQDDLEIEDLQIDPRSVKEGEPVTVTADVTNTSATENNTYTIELKINDEIVDSETIDLEAQESQTISFTITAGKPGDYIVDLNGANDYFTVKSSFTGMFPSYLWALVIAIVVVLVIFIVILVVMPSRKKQSRSVPKTKGPSMPPHAMSPPTAPPPIPGPGMGPGPMPPQSRMAQPMQPSMPPSTPVPAQPPMQHMGQPQFQTPFPAPGPMAAPHPPRAGRPMFQLRNLVITPNQLKQGDAATINTIVSNNGTEHGKYSVVLRIGGVVEGITEVDLAPGTSQAVVFTVIKEEPGTYYVEVDGLAGSFLVIALVPAHFNVGNLAITPDRAKQGESITVSAIVTNAGEITGSHSLELKIKGAVEAVEEVDLGPGESQRVAFNIIKETPGFYQVELEGLTGRFVIEMEWQG